VTRPAPLANGGGMAAPEFDRRTPSDRVYTPSSTDAHLLPSSSSSPSHAVSTPYEQAMPASATMPAGLGAGRASTTPRKRQRRDGKDSDGSIDTGAGFLSPNVPPPARGPEPLISGRLCVPLFYFRAARAH
jgi:hypothetical protein